MKVLCPIDFSEVSVNASKWATDFLKLFGEAELHLAHFIFFQRRAGMFMKVDDIFEERAIEDFKQLKEELTQMNPALTIESSVYSANPKEAIANLAKRDDFDYVIMGTTGLTALKNMTIGSVAENVINKCNVPVFTIPQKVSFTKLQKIALAVDDEIIENLSTLSSIKDLVIKSGAEFNILHVEEKGDSPFEYDPGIDMYLRNVDYKYDKIELDGTLTNTINNYCRNNNIDILCMVHHKRNWLEQLFTKSITKAELFHLELPMLVVGG